MKVGIALKPGAFLMEDYFAVSMASAQGFSTTSSGFLCSHDGCSGITASTAVPYSTGSGQPGQGAAEDDDDGDATTLDTTFFHPYIFITEVGKNQSFPAGAFLACKRKPGTTASDCSPAPAFAADATRAAAGLVYSVVAKGTKFLGDGRFYSVDLTAPACAASEDGCVVNTHDTVPTDGFAVFGVAKDSAHKPGQIEVWCPIADPVSAPQSFSCNFCGLSSGTPTLGATRMNGAISLGWGQGTCQSKQDQFNAGASYDSTSCSNAQLSHMSTCCEATCELCAAGTSLKNGSAIGGHYSDGTLYTCAAARERLYSFTAASDECNVDSNAGQYRFASAAACCVDDFPSPPPPSPPSTPPGVASSSPPSPPPAAAPPTCDICGAQADVVHFTGRKVITGILQPTCWAGKFETNETTQVAPNGFEKKLEWATIGGVEGAGAPHGDRKSVV